jgi:hypothetical protein
VRRSITLTTQFKVRVSSKGVELSFTANPMKGFNVIAGFSNKSEVTKTIQVMVI